MLLAVMFQQLKGARRLATETTKFAPVITGGLCTILSRGIEGLDGHGVADRGVISRLDCDLVLPLSEVSRVTGSKRRDGLVRVLLGRFRTLGGWERNFDFIRVSLKKMLF